MFLTAPATGTCSRAVRQQRSIPPYFLIHEQPQTPRSLSACSGVRRQWGHNAAAVIKVLHKFLHHGGHQPLRGSRWLHPLPAALPIGIAAIALPLSRRFHRRRPPAADGQKSEPLASAAPARRSDHGRSLRSSRSRSLLPSFQNWALLRRPSCLPPISPAWVAMALEPYPAIWPA